MNAPPISQQPLRWEEEPWELTAPFHNIKQKFKNGSPKQRVKLSLLVFGIPFLVLFVLFIFRPALQPYLLLARIYFGGILLVAGVVVPLWFKLRRRSAILKTFGTTIAVAIVGLVFVVGAGIHDYLAQYSRYISLGAVDFAQLPTTSNERILPLNGVYSLAKERMNTTEDPSLPDLVRVDTDYRWTMAVQPSQWWGLFWNPVNEIISISAADASPDFSRREPISVNFSIGENLLLSRNIDRCVRRSFGPIRSLSYEPGNVFYIKDDAGAWVEAVSLIKWSGVIFPWPEFGGVQIIHQGRTNTVGRIFLGCGEWIPPGEIEKHPYLRGQNLMPSVVSRFMAESLRFQNGFLGPLPFSRQGDIRIADVSEDANPQPYTLAFRFKEGDSAKLYQYFALQPRDHDKEGLTTSFFVPADGQGPRYVYSYVEHHEAPIGPTVVADKVRSAYKSYDWTKYAPVEVRPYISDLPDSKGVVARRFLWMVTIMTIVKAKPGEQVQYTTSGDPEVVIVDALNNRVVAVDNFDPTKWPGQLSAALGPIWASNNR
jgi:hypothetical protein